VGSRPVIVVPRPGSELISSVPPCAASRSDMPCSPEPDRPVLAKPCPSSLIENSSPSARHLGGLGTALLNLGDLVRARAVLPEAAALFQGTGNMVYLPWCLEGLAALAAADGDFARAAVIVGARDALRAQTGIGLPPVYPAGYAGMLVTVRDHLGEAEFTAARARLAGQPPPAIMAAVFGGAGPEGEEDS
jgi:hypothetical protein